jgi:glycosyltransferase involved in cell wall biosynthesis
METLKFLMPSTFYPPHHVGGDATHVKYLADALSKEGHDVCVFYNLDAYKIKNRIMPSIENVKIKTIKNESFMNFTPYWVHTFGNYRPMLKRYKTIIDEMNPDVIHNHNISLLGYGLLEKRFDYANLYTAHDYWLICQRNDLFKNGKVCYNKSCFSCSFKSKRPYQYWRNSSKFKKTISNIDLTIMPSNYMKNRILDELSINALTIPNFVPEPPSKIEDSGYSNYFLFVGSLEVHKGILELLEVFENNKHDIDSKLLIIGTGTLESYIKTFIRSKNLEDLIIFIGWKNHDEIYPFYKDAQALIIPSIWSENAPLVTLESLSVGTPIIGSNRGGIPEILAKVDDKLIFDAEDFNSLAKLLKEYDKTHYPEKKVLKIYEKEFSIGVYLEKYLKAINEL